MILMNAGDLPGAEERLGAAVKLDVRDPVAAYDLGLVFAREGKYREARAAYENAVARDPGFAPGQFELGRELERAGDVMGAVEHHAAAALLKRDAPALERLGVALEMLGRPEESERYFREALEIDPGLGSGRTAPRGQPAP